MDIITVTVLDAVRELKEAVLARFNLTGKPLRITEYTSGAGIHERLPESTYQIILLIGGGGTGGQGYNQEGRNYLGAGGNTGEELRLRVQLLAQVAYEVGAPSAGNGDVGGTTRLGGCIARGGGSGAGASYSTASPLPAEVVYTPENGLTPSRRAVGSNGATGFMGVGAKSSTTGRVPASGYGAGGAGGVNGLPPLPGTGGYIRIEEY